MPSTQHDWNARLISFFSKNSRLVVLLIAAIIVGGIFSLLSLKRAGFPEITPAIAVIQTVYPGASATQVESQVTKKIESSLKDLKGLQDFSSTSQNSFSNVVVQLDSSVVIDQAIQEIQSKVQSGRAELPSDAEQPKIIQPRTGNYAFIYGITSSGDMDHILDDTQQFIDELSNVSEVKSASILNERLKQITITYRPADIRANGVSLAAISQIFQSMNLDFPVGKLELGNKEESVTLTGSFKSLDDIKNLIIGVNPATQQPVKLSTIADVAEEREAPTNVERFGYLKDGKHLVVPGTLVAVDITKQADIIKARSAIEKMITDKKADDILPEELEVVMLSDQAQSTQEQVTEIVEGALGASRNFYLLGGLQLLFLAILLFVNFRAALVAALSIPLSLGITFIFLALTGTELNTIVLFSLVLVLGLIVDPAIIVVEAIQRYRDLGLTPEQAVLESGRRYGASLFMAVLTSLIVFAPFGVVSGIFGQIIQYIPLTVVPALVASYFIPIAILPFISQRFLKSQSHKHVDKSEEESLSAAARAVMAANRWILAKTWRGIALLVVSLVLVGLSVSLIGMGKVQIVQFSTPEDNKFLSISLNLEKGLNFAEREKITKQVEEVAFKEGAVKQYYYYDQGADSATLMVDLLEKNDRPGSENASKAVVQRINDGIKGIEKLTDYSVKELASGPPSSDYQVQTQLFASDPVVLEKAAKDVGAMLRETEHVTKVEDGYTGQKVPEFSIVLDRTKVQQLGLSSIEVAQQLKTIIDKTELGKFTNPDTQLDESIYLVSDTKPDSMDALKKLPLVSRTGTALTLADVATIESTEAVSAIQRSNGTRFVNVQARVDDQTNVLAVQKKLDDYLTNDKIKELGLNSRANQGDYEDIAKSFRDLGIALGIAIFLTYVVLVLQFKSFSQPAIMLYTIPLSLIGVFPALWLSGSDLGFLELLGITILVGIVENVAIFLIDYANQQIKEKNMSPREAIIEASGVRFRPILLTKLVALGGLLPLAIESDFWRGLSVVIIAGIGLSGFFSLVTIPVLFVWIDALRRKIHRQPKVA